MRAHPIYEREHKPLDWYDVQSAISYSRSRCIVGKIAEWKDTKTVGLTLRITPGKAVWYIRRRETTLRIGLATAIEVDLARFFAEQTRLAAGRNRNLREYVETLVRLETTAEYENPEGHLRWADALADETSSLAVRKRIGDTGLTWTWRALTHHFLDYKKPKLRESYRKQYEHYLTLKEFACINDKLVRDITLRDLERVRDEILLNHARSAVHRALTQSKRMLSWAWKFRASASGLDNVPGEWWSRWSFEYSTSERSHEPTVEEIARTLVLADTFRHLADGEHDTYPGTIGALWGVALTGQRSGAFVKLRDDRMFDAKQVDPKLRGWTIAKWTADEMKGGRGGGRPHSLPIPPAAVNVLRKFRDESNGGSDWMFIGHDSKKHITKSALNQLMDRLQGKVYDHTVKSKPPRKGKPARNLVPKSSGVTSSLNSGSGPGPCTTAGGPSRRSSTTTDLADLPLRSLGTKCRTRAQMSATSSRPSLNNTTTTPRRST